MPDEMSWLTVAADLGVRVIAPFTVVLGEHRVTVTALFPGFGAPSGMVIDPEWSVIEPYAMALTEAGFGYSCVDLHGISREDMRALLIDWGWNGPLQDKPHWA